MATFNYQRPVLYPKQEQAFFNTSRFSIIFGSTKSGKSVAALAWLFEQAIKDAKATGAYWWLAPTYSQAQIMYRRLHAYIPDHLYTANDSELTIKLINGNFIRFKTAEKTDNLFGEDVHALVLDEGSRCREEIWFVIRSVLTATQGPARLVGNVRGKNWFWKIYQKHLNGVDKEYSCHSIDAWDAVAAGVVPRSEIESAQASLPRHQFEELYLNIPADTGTNPFGYDAIAGCVREISNRPPVVYGWDLAKSVDWVVGIGLDEYGQVCRYHRWQGSWETTIDKIIQITGNAPALVDATGVGDPVLELLQKGRSNFEGYKFSSNSKQQLMEGLAMGIQSGQVRFPDNEIRKELESFEFEYTKTGVRYSAPEGMHDDCVCSLALAWRHYCKPQNMYLLDMLAQL